MTLTKEELDDLFGTLAVQVETTVAAPPEAVWDLLADVTRIGEFSPECKQAEWLDGATGAAVGARFAGYNQKGPRECSFGSRWSGRRRYPVPTSKVVGY